MSRSKSRGRRVSYANRRLPTSLRYYKAVYSAPRDIAARDYRSYDNPKLFSVPRARSLYGKRNFFRKKRTIHYPKTDVFYPAPVYGWNVGASLHPSLRSIICLRRNIRKEVLHAFRKTGKAGQRRPRRTQYSLIRCGG